MQRGKTYRFRNDCRCGGIQLPAVEDNLNVVERSKFMSGKEGNYLCESGGNIKYSNNNY